MTTWTKIFEDLFTGTDDDDLVTGHSPDTGNDWTDDWTPGGSPKINASNQVKVAWSSPVNWLLGAPPGVTVEETQRVQCDQWVATDSGPVLRYTFVSSSDWDGYVPTFKTSPASVRLYKVAAASFSQLAESFGPVWTGGDEMRLDAVVNGGTTDFTLYQNGVSKLTHSDSAISGGAFGFYGQRNVDPHLDNFSGWHEAAGGGTAVDADHRGPFGALAGVRADHRPQAGALAALAANHRAPFDALRAVATGGPVPLAWAVTVDAPGVAALDWLAALAADGRAPVTARRTLFASHATAPVEWSGAIAVSADAPLPLDWQGMAAAGQVLALESAATVIVDKPVPTEFSAGVIANPQALFSWLAAAGGDLRLPTEWDGSIVAFQADAAMPLEWPARPTFVDGNATVFRADARARVFALPGRGRVFRADRRARVFKTNS